MATPIKPLVLVCSTPVSGHIIPIHAIAKQLVAGGNDVCFVSGSGYREQVEATGASFVPVKGYSDFYDLRARDLDPLWPIAQKTLQGPANSVHNVVHIFRTLKMLSDKHPDRHIILMTESLDFGALPLILGAPGIRPKGFIAVGLNSILLTSINHPPFGPAKKPEIFLLDSLYVLPDRFIQMCTPRVEDPRSDAPRILRFAQQNQKKKKVFVYQGTVATDITQLVIPTMTAFKERSDIIVVVALGKKETALPAGLPVPSNPRVADYIHYDDLLPYCDVFVTTGGYGAFQRALNNGTPLASAAVNLRTDNPSTEQLAQAVDEIVSNKKYRARALEIQAEIATYDSVGVIIENIEELVGRSV
ncbi:MGT family glycosyltransferase [Halenospora varia]|nr:MGT family glycosyltransferase [Halenospora varia]